MSEYNGAEVSYGFFYYDPSIPECVENPTRVDVGETSENLEFSAEVTGIPIETEHIVCAFVVVDGHAEMNIGDEVTFVVPKP